MQHPTFKKLKIFLLGVSFIFLLMLGLNVKLSIVRFGSEEARAVDASGFSYDVVDNCLRVDTEFCPLPVKVDSPQLCISGDCKSSWGAVSGFWSDGGSGRIYYNGGNVGIGTTNPNRLLHVYKTSGDNAEIDIQSVSGSNQHWGIYHDRTTDDLRFWNNDPTGEKNILTLTNDGKVGIGTTAPGAALEVIGNVIAQTPTASNHLATRAYVDAAVAAGGSGSCAGPFLEWRQVPVSPDYIGVVQMGPAGPGSGFSWRLGAGDWGTWLNETGGSNGTRWWQYNFGLAAGKTIYIFGRDVGGAYSNMISFSVVPDIPAVPTNLQADSGLGKFEIGLSWVDNSFDETGFYVYRSTVSGFAPSPANRIATTGSSFGKGLTVTYSDKNIVPDIQYYYKVSAYNELGESAYSNEVETTYQRFTILYVTVGGHTGDFDEGDGARAGADVFCQSSKPADLVCNNIHAFLGTSSEDEVRDMPGNYGYVSNLPVYWYHSTNKVLTQLASSWSDMLDGSILVSQIDGTGNNRGPRNCSKADGSIVPGAVNCCGFYTKSGVPYADSSSYSTATDGRWLYAGSFSYSCDSNYWPVRCACTP